MLPFRNHTPKHRKNRKVCIEYKSYKSTLRVDFKQRCAYCNDLDANRIRQYVIDHFIPRNPSGWNHSIPPNQYSNLMYACPYCNGAKSNKWPTKNIRKFNNGKQGFLKPTTASYAKLFHRDARGNILVLKKAPIGIYLYRELNLSLAIHSLNWRFERIIEQEKKIKALSNKTKLAKYKKELIELKASRTDIVDEIFRLMN